MQKRVHHPVLQVPALLRLVSIREGHRPTTGEVR
jgi:hypothetical protein